MGYSRTMIPLKMCRENEAKKEVKMQSGKDELDIDDHTQAWTSKGKKYWLDRGRRSRVEADTHGCTSTRMRRKMCTLTNKDTDEPPWKTVAGRVADFRTTKQESRESPSQDDWGDYQRV